MKSFELKHITRASTSVGYKPEETRKILDGSLFSESDIGLLGLLKNSLKDQGKREMLLDILESRSKNPVPLSEIINVFDKFSNLQEKFKQELTEADIKLLNFTIKYFEDWFYRGKWTKIPKKQKQNPNAYAYFSVPAGILNMITKIKEIPKYSDKIVSLDSNKLTELQPRVHDFRDEFLSEERLSALLDKKDITPEEISAINMILQNRQKIINTFNDSERSVKNEFAGRGSGSNAPDLYFIKTCLITAEMLERNKVKGPNHIFIPETEIKKQEGNYLLYDFSGGRDYKKNSMHYHRSRTAYCKFVVEYLKKQNN